MYDTSERADGERGPAWSGLYLWFDGRERCGKQTTVNELVAVFTFPLAVKSDGEDGGNGSLYRITHAALVGSNRLRQLNVACTQHRSLITLAARRS